MTEPTLYKALSAQVDRLERNIERWESARENTPNFKDLDVRLAPLEVRITAIEKNLQALQDANRWVTRTAMGALVLAVLDPMLRVFGTG